MKPEIYILKNEEIEVHISNLGATLVRMITKNKNDEPIDVILGFDEAAAYESPEYLADCPYLGAGIGRYGNRIAGGKFELNGKEYTLAVNNGPNHLHGGICGFNRKIWTVVDYKPDTLALHYISEDGEEGYPGNLTTDIVFSIIGKELHIHYQATTDKECYVNLTHHPYFNLEPENIDVREHILKLFSGCYLKTNDLIPDGTFVKAAGPYDFIHPQRLRNAIDQCGGLDDCYIFPEEKGIVKMAELSSDRSGIKLYVCSDYPGLQVYTGRYLNVKNGKNGVNYGPFSGVALEAQFWPDSPHHPHFPSTLLLPGEVYDRTTVYGFE